MKEKQKCGFDLLDMRSFSLMESAKSEIRKCNDICARFGLSLSENDIEELMTARHKALKETGRIEFSGGIMPKLIFEFCDSPFIDQSNFLDTLIELQEAFYYYKNESEDSYTDDELIEYMVKVFNGRAKGSALYLIGTSLYELARYARMGYNPNNPDEAGDLF